jgi:ABC-2 type transport system ATP-binding protein
MIEVQGISKSYGSVKAVDNLSFTIKEGEIVGFLGPNGAGKTTTMRILTCYHPADEGEAKIAGFDVFEESLAVREKIGYLPENAPLYPDMRVDSFLDYVGSIRGMKGEAKAAAIGRMAGACGLTGVMMKQIGELSKGYRQRVGLAQAMIHDPDILILDEPTSGLDPNQIVEIRSLIKKLGEKKTVILSTHILSEVENTCNRVIVINKGKIVEDGSIEAVTRRTHRGNLHVILVRGEKGKIEDGLKSLSDVVSFEKKDEEGGLLRYEIAVREGVHLGEQLFRMAADRGLSLAEIRREKAALESAFAALTIGAGEKAAGKEE